jgi:prepilin-type N-terminal cleavage/methylation domain-containing protein
MSIDDDDREAGFTLVEVLVVLSIVALMSSLMLAMMGQFHGLIMLDRTLSRQATLQKVADYVAGLLEHAEAIPLDNGPDVPVQFVDGTSDSVSFLSATRTGAHSVGLSKIHIEMDDGSIIQLNSLRRFEPSENVADKYVLLENGTSLKFSYLQKPIAPNTAPQWQDEWHLPGEFPVAIKVRLDSTLENGHIVAATSTEYIAR